ncbi:MAG TPA: PadR family transcriptional regulator [Baekduia sp.]|uniref:PadR family transcriptional regulator n=1 Tax=Baekduia sp. TaxID=2600305 RepID=UPI002D7704C0|nr:PadR family transcriptional regulator [Baekduia sp.]HET6508938.1 PadR family transcriptional regulator [Baekduia sp.]
MLRHALLGLLAERPMSGYELDQRFEASVGSTWTAGHSQIYPELNRLADEGLIEAGEPGPRGRKTYAITDAGVAAVRAWLSETDPDRTVRDEAALRTYFLWLMEPDAARAHVARERDAANDTLRSLRATAAARRPATAAERSQRIALEAGLRWAQARAEWADWALARLDGVAERGEDAA